MTEIIICGTLVDVELREVIFFSWSMLFLTCTAAHCYTRPQCIVCMAITFSKSMDQPGKVTNPARGQLNREINISLSPFEPKIRSRETGSAVRSRVSLLILHTQAQSGAY